MSKARSFIIKIAIAITALVVIDKCAGYFLERSYFNIHHGEQGRTSFTLDSARTDILIIGSSRASHHYVPSIIADSLHMSCYNGGKDKQGIYYWQAISEAVWKRWRPKYTLLDLTPAGFEKSEAGLDVLSILLPYYYRHPELQSILNKRSWSEKIKAYSNLYRYNSLLLQILFNKNSSARDAGASDGYVPLNTAWQEHDSPITNGIGTRAPDSTLVNVFRHILENATSAQTKLIVIISPLYDSLYGYTSTASLAKTICQQNGVVFLDYSHHPQFSGQKQLFADEQHLNDSGAHVFSRLLSSDLLRYR